MRAVASCGGNGRLRTLPAWMRKSALSYSKIEGYEYKIFVKEWRRGLGLNKRPEIGDAESGGA
jgi:hypothetical protein